MSMEIGIQPVSIHSGFHRFLVTNTGFFLVESLSIWSVLTIFVNFHLSHCKFCDRRSFKTIFFHRVRQIDTYCMHNLEFTTFIVANFTKVVRLEWSSGMFAEISSIRVEFPFSVDELNPMVLKTLQIVLQFVRCKHNWFCNDNL